MTTGRNQQPPVHRARRTAALLVLWHLFRPARGRLYLALLFFFLKNLPAFVLPIVTGHIVNVIVAPPAGGIVPAILGDCILLLAVTVQNIPSNVLSDFFFSKANYDVQVRLRTSLLHELRVPEGAREKFHAGSLHAKFLRDAEVISLVSFQIFRAVTPAALGIAFVLAHTVATVPFMALFFVLTVPIASLIVVAFHKQLARRNEEFRRSVEVMSASMATFLQSLREGQPADTQPQAFDACAIDTKEVRERGVRLDVANAFYISVVWVSFALFQFACLLLSGWLAFRRVISVGDMVMYQGFFVMLAGNVAGLIGVYPDIARGMESVRSVGEVIEDGAGHTSATATSTPLPVPGNACPAP